jgi:V8-like Glu-specific endopeptidase
MTKPPVAADVARNGAAASDLLIPGTLTAGTITSKIALIVDLRSSNQKPHAAMKFAIRSYARAFIVAGLWSIIAVANAQSQNGVISEEIDAGAQAPADAQAIEAYWTPEQMANAIPMPAPMVIVDSLALAVPPISEENGEAAAPGYAPGCRPNASSCDNAPRTLSSPHGFSSESVAYGDMMLPLHGSKPTNPKNGPYGPFQRWREANPITAYPKSTVGKLFFTLNNQNFVCSASVINRSTLITAGHCNSDGAGHFATNRLFCPSFNGVADPTRGCWSVITSTVSGHWHTSGDPDYDYACLITATTGTVVANKIGNVTGWLGRAWNFGSSQPERTFGYPQAAPFSGGTLQTTASTDWYTHDFTSGGQISKIIGSDLTGGSSGGPWILGWTGGLAETPDTDASGATDPGNNWVNGVNSHKRCLVNCNTPPTTTNGVFWQEMTSPPFRNTTTDNDESEDVIASCFAHANNNR